MTDLNIEVVKRKAGCEHSVSYEELSPTRCEVQHDDGTPQVAGFGFANDDGTTRPWVTEVIEWIRGLHT